MADLSDFFRGFQLPTMPEVAQSLVRTLNEHDVPVAKIRDLISKDPALTVKVLRLANSARFGLKRQVASLDDAIMLVGLAQVRTLALSCCLNDAFPVVGGLDRGEFWRQSMACAGYAQWLTTNIGGDRHEAWLAGFMVRLGELVIATALPGCMAEIEQLPHYPGSRWQRECNFLGFSEGEVTAELARRWQFPREIVRGLTHAANPLEARPFSRLGAIVHIAQLLAEMPAEHPEVIEELPQDIMDTLLVDREWMRNNMPAYATLVDTSVLN
ncbi:MAG: HDOD domain-containing protein [Burkholderiales bacterium]|nr:HDOD domain-containing protein [Burkholderiales bacterium]